MGQINGFSFFERGKRFVINDGFYKMRKDSETARSFVLKMEEIIENLTEEQIKTLREKLNNAHT